MAQGGVGIFLLATLAAAAAGAATTCSYDPITWSCSAQSSRLTLEFDGVTINANECGNSYSKDLFGNIVSLTYKAASNKANYTAIMVDPDAPGHQGGDAWLHWIRAGLTSADLKARTLTSGTEIISYHPPTPPKKSGVHRYFVYLYEETQTIPEEDLPRGKFDLAAYVSKHQLCGPLASNMFKTEY